jgi:hydrogenase/urease accessory protein HupE
MRAFFACLLAFCVLVAPRLASAHAFEPSLIEARERADGTFDVAWRPSARAMDRPPPDVTVRDGRVTARGLGGLEAVVRVTLQNGEKVTGVLRGDADAVAIPRGRAPALEVARSYGALGVTHILGGFDHLLFVLALVIIVKDRRKLVATITAFTLAHSLTLALTVTGALAVPAPLTEVLIALSILLLAVEMARPRQTWTARAPWAVAFAFGLLHGLGFAGALAEIGLPRGQLALSLASFNVGVELGQLAFVAAVLALRALLAKRLKLPRLAPAYVIGAASAAFTIDRVLDTWRPHV